jgi:hypothetical protein
LQGEERFFSEILPKFMRKTPLFGGFPSGFVLTVNIGEQVSLSAGGNRRKSCQRLFIIHNPAVKGCMDKRVRIVNKKEP